MVVGEQVNGNSVLRVVGQRGHRRSVRTPVSRAASRETGEWSPALEKAHLWVRIESCSGAVRLLLAHLRPIPLPHHRSKLIEDGKRRNLELLEMLVGW